MTIELLSITPNAEQHIEFCGRTCYNSMDKMTEETAPGFIKGLISRGHLSVLEHASASFKIENVSRSLTHQLVRHRLASYSQESQRYVAIETNRSWFVIPDSIGNNDAASLVYLNTMYQIAKAYEDLLKLVPKEDARFVLPNSCKTSIVMSGNFRMWFEMMTKRLDDHAQWEIRELVEAIRSELNKYAPSVFAKSNFRSEE